MSLVTVDRVALSLPCSPKTAPPNLHDATVQALLSSMPQLTSIQPNHHTFRTYASSTPGSQETETNFIRHPICADRSIVLKPNQRRFTHKRNKSAPIWLHNPPPPLSPTMEIERRNSLDEIHQFDYPCLPLKFPSSASTDEGVGLGYESGSVSTPSTDERIDNKSIDSCINSYDIDEAYNTDSSQDFSGYPGLVNSSTWIDVQQEQGDDNMVSVKVGSKSSHVVHFSVKAGDVITWEFATTKRDIGFGILFECSVVEEADPEENPEEPSDVDSITSGYGVIPILPIFKVKSNISPIFGSHEAVTDGVYVMTWDNSYSRFFAKELYYRISTQTEIRSSEFPYSVVSVQHSYATMSCPALEEVEESYSNYSSANHSPRTSVSENNEIESHNTLCETPPSPTSSHRPSPTDNVYRIQQNVGQEGQTVYFDVAANTELNKIEDI